jgi:hypothetical protein
LKYIILTWDHGNNVRIILDEHYNTRAFKSVGDADDWLCYNEDELGLFVKIVDLEE